MCQAGASAAAPLELVVLDKSGLRCLLLTGHGSLGRLLLLGQLPHQLHLVFGHPLPKLGEVHHRVLGGLG